MLFHCIYKYFYCNKKREQVLPLFSWPLNFPLCYSFCWFRPVTPIDLRVISFHSFGISDVFRKEFADTDRTLPQRGHLASIPIGMALPTCKTIGSPHLQHFTHLILVICWYICNLLRSKVHLNVIIIPYLVMIFNHYIFIF